MSPYYKRTNNVPKAGLELFHYFIIEMIPMVVSNDKHLDSIGHISR